MKNQNRPGFSLKDHLFNQERVQYLAGLFGAADAGFDAAGFVKHTMKQLGLFELKARIVHIATVLERFLPSDFRAAARQIVEALPEPLDPHRTDDDFGDFIFAPLGEYVVRNGLSAKHLKLSLNTLREITQRFSMEDAIRSFINSFPDETLAELSSWATHRHYHVRRLVSEGTRPLLPWSPRLTIDSQVPLPLLDQLYADPTRYVTRSVANHLNDLSKTQPQVVLQMLQRWDTEGRQSEPELRWMTRHALRTLIKRGDQDTLTFLGYSTRPKIRVNEFRLHPETLNPGDTFEFSVNMTARSEEQLVVDYVIDFVKAGGRRSSRVHKLRQMRLGRGETVTISKRHTLRANATTYTLYPGIHTVTLQINGQSFGQQSFELLPGHA